MFGVRCWMFDVCFQSHLANERPFRDSVDYTYSGRRDRTAAARRHRRDFFAQYLFRAAPSQFPSLFLRPAHFAHRNLDDDDGARLARLSTHRIESIARRCRGLRFSADARFLHLGRLGRRSLSETLRSRGYANQLDDSIARRWRRWCGVVM